MKGGGVAGLPVCVLVSPLSFTCGPVEWWGWWVVCCPVFGLGLASCIVPPPFTLFVPFVSFPFLFCLVFVVGGEVRCLVVLCCGLWNGGVCGGSVSSFVFFFFLFVLVFGVVRAQLCEHARYPRTPLRLPCLLCLLFPSLLSSSRLLAFLRAPPFCAWNGGG